MRIRWILVISLLMVILISGCGVTSSTASNFNRQISSITRPYTFNFGTWEWNTLIENLKRNLETGGIADIANTRSVIDYFSLVAQRDSLESKMQALLTQKTDNNNASIEASIDEASRPN